jgi:hypothetical protein
VRSGRLRKGRPGPIGRMGCSRVGVRSSCYRARWIRRIGVAGATMQADHRSPRSNREVQRPRWAGGHVFACLLWIVFCGHGGTTFFDAFVPVARHLSEELMKGAAMLNAIKASLLGSALMLLASCTGYLTNYQTPCVQGHVCECVQYTTVYRSWLDCRAYGKDAPRRR